MCKHSHRRPLDGSYAKYFFLTVFERVFINLYHFPYVTMINSAGIINVTFVTNTIYKWSWLFNTYYDCNIFKYTIWYTVRTLCCLSSVSVHNGCLKHILKHYYSLSLCLVFTYCFNRKVENCLDLFDQDNKHMVYVLTLFVIYRRRLVLLS